MDRMSTDFDMSDTIVETRNGPIGIFDSGVGGLTVASEISAILPGEHLVYLGDTARVPYGTKSCRTVERYSMENARMLLGYGAKIVVAACNTASALASDRLRESLTVPVVDVVTPGARAAAAATRTGRIGVIGTSSTISSKAYDHALKNIDSRLHVYSASCPLFVPLAEEGWTEGSVPTAVAREYIEPLLSECIDVLLLGCTHYPLLKKTIQYVCGPDVVLVDSAKTAAVDVRNVIECNGIHRDDGGDGEKRFFVTDLPDKFAEVAGRFFGCEGIDLSLVDMPSAQGLPAIETCQGS